MTNDIRTGVIGDAKFQSTSPVWGMTDVWRAARYTTRISIHIPRVGDDDLLL